MKLGKAAQSQLLAAAAERDIYLEGNVLKLLEAEGSKEFQDYIDTATNRDRDARRRRLDITKQVQKQNVDLLEAQKRNESLMQDLKDALGKAEAAKAVAENAKVAAEESLDVLQKKTQFELVSVIVKVALMGVLGVGLVASLLYALTILTGSKESEPVGHTWSSIFGILLTNSFSILGTVMGVKYARGDRPSTPKK